MAPFVTKVYDGGTIYHGVSNLHLQFAFQNLLSVLSRLAAVRPLPKLGRAGKKAADRVLDGQFDTEKV